MIRTPDIDALDARYLLSGIDTLEFTAPMSPAGAVVPLAPWNVSEKSTSLAFHLEQERLAVVEGKTVTVELAGEVFTLEKRGAKSYRWVLTSEWGNILLTDAEHMAGWQVKGELEPFALWHQGAENAYHKLRKAISALFGCADGWPARVSRVDLAMDFQGFDFDDFAAARALELIAIVTKAGTMGPYEEPDAHCHNPRCGYRLDEDSTFCKKCAVRRGQKMADGDWPAPEWNDAQLAEKSWFKRRRGGYQTCTGWRWAEGSPCTVRLYNKTEKIRKTPKTAWWLTKYKACPNYSPGQVIARLEMQLRREFLKEVVLDTLDGKVRVDTVDDVIKHAAALWRYCVGSPWRECKTCGAVKVPKYERDRYCTACRDRILQEWFQQQADVDGGAPDERTKRAALRDHVSKRLLGLYPDAARLGRMKFGRPADIRREAKINRELRSENRERITSEFLATFKDDPTPLELHARGYYRLEMKRALKRGINDVLAEMFADISDKKKRAIERQKFLSKLLKPAELLRPKGWLEVRRRIGEDSNTSRLPLLPWWQKVQLNEFQFSGAPAEEAHRVKIAASIEVARSQMRGNATSFASAKGIYEELRTRLRREEKRAPTAEDVVRAILEEALENPEEVLSSLLRKIEKRGALVEPPEDSAALLAEYQPERRTPEWSLLKERKRKKIRPRTGVYSLLRKRLEESARRRYPERVQFEESEGARAEVKPNDATRPPK